jgi:uncharacterized protein (TIRG00374 family)
MSPGVVLAIKCAVSLALLAVVGYASREALGRALQGPPERLLGFAPALALYLGGVVLAFVRWWLLVRAQGLALPLREAMRLGWIGMFFNLVIPGAVGGDVVKAAYFLRDQDHKGRAVASIVIDRIVALVGLFTLATATGLMNWGRFDGRLRRVVVTSAVCLGIGLVLLALAFAIRPHGPIGRRLSRRPRGERLVHELHAVGLAYRQRLGVVAGAVAMAVGTHLANVLAFAFVAGALRSGTTEPSLAEHLAIVPLVLFSMAVPLPFSGLGAAENAGALLYRSVDYDGGGVAVLGFRVLQVAAAAIGAMAFTTYRRKAKAAAVAEGAPAAGPGGPRPADT